MTEGICPSCIVHKFFKLGSFCSFNSTTSSLEVSKSGTFFQLIVALHVLHGILLH